MSDGRGDSGEINLGSKPSLVESGKLVNSTSSVHRA